jgi:uncharacterized protein YbjT (DUF2867 family)
MSTVAIVGATGFVGTALTLQLLDRGHHVSALSRRPDRWPLQHHDLKVHRGDLLDGKALQLVLKGADAAYYLVHGLAEDDEDFEWAESRAATSFVQAAIRAKVRRVIFLGALGPEQDASQHLRSRHLVGDILGLLPGICVEFRASIVLGANSTSFEMIKALHQRLPVRPYAPWLETPCQPIALDDLLQYLLAALDLQGEGHHVVDIGAPEVVSYGELLDIYGRMDGQTRTKFLLPAMDQRLLLPTLDLVLPEFSVIGKKLFLSLVHPTVVEDAEASTLFPEIKPMSLDEAMRRAYQESKTHYPAVWEGDFWKELRDQTVLQTRHGQQLLLDKLRELTESTPLTAVGKLKKRLTGKLKRKSHG